MHARSFPYLLWSCGIDALIMGKIELCHTLNMGNGNQSVKMSARLSAAGHQMAHHPLVSR